MAQTLFALAGVTPPLPSVRDVTLVLIDYQNEYLEGPLALFEVEPTVAKAALLLEAARASGSPVIHIAHAGEAGGLFDRTARRGAIVDALAPLPGELLIEKPRPNAFSGTTLADELDRIAKPVLFAGFMTHMCVSSTVRVALDLGYHASVAADACATRDLPGLDGTVSAATLHDATLAALGDRFAGIFRTQDLLASR